MMWRKLADVAYWIGISLYFGGLMAVGIVVAPAVFSTARSSQIAMPGIVAPPLSMDTQVGGEVFGEVLNRFSWFEAIGLGLMLAGLAGWILGHRHVRRSTWVLLVLWLMVAGLAAFDAGWLRPLTWSQRSIVRQEAPAHVQEGPGAVWPARARFEQLHKWSESVAHSKGYILLAMILVTAWRGLADKRSIPTDKGDVMRRVMAQEKVVAPARIA